MWRFRVVRIHQVSRKCVTSHKYVIQKRKWFTWKNIAEFSDMERTEALMLLDALSKLPKRVVIGVA